jgi:hypothetical protein
METNAKTMHKYYKMNLETKVEDLTSRWLQNVHISTERKNDGSRGEKRVESGRGRDGTEGVWLTAQSRKELLCYVILKLDGAKQRCEVGSGLSVIK